ncbi:hypothetical protein O3P69_008406 [Scylla paramamosain]|uniref:Uncharacterized protein n=1 Tax=Scylla paramamosain TaxID=85552 RepID=A0AAW0SKZ7_SCYPA
MRCLRGAGTRDKMRPYTRHCGVGRGQAYLLKANAVPGKSGHSRSLMLILRVCLLVAGLELKCKEKGATVTTHTIKYGFTFEITTFKSAIFTVLDNRKSKAMFFTNPRNSLIFPFPVFNASTVWWKCP